MTGKVIVIFPGFQGFPDAVGTLYVISIMLTVNRPINQHCTHNKSLIATLTVNGPKLTCIVRLCARVESSPVSV